MMADDLFYSVQLETFTPPKLNIQFSHQEHCSQQISNETEKANFIAEVNSIRLGMIINVKLTLFYFLKMYLSQKKQK